MVDYKRFSKIKGETALMDSADIDVLTKSLGPVTDAVRMIKDSQAKIVAIGEGSHGTKEFYALRCEITKQLITDKLCDCVLIEGDWPDTAALHRYVTGMSDISLDEALGQFDRFPRWMWRNETMKEFLLWLHDRNMELPAAQRCGIFGLDVYSLHRSMEAVLTYLRANDPETAKAVEKDYSCFDKFGDDAQVYGRIVQMGVAQGCAKAATRALSLTQDSIDQYEKTERVKSGQDNEIFVADDQLIARLNAEVVVDAEEYYRSMFNPKDNSWNIRDTHFYNTLKKVRAHLLITRKRDRVAVWAHNSHLGDARFTHLDASRYTAGQELNIGQLIKEKHESECILVGQLTNTGTVLAADDWDGPGKVKQVRGALPDSYEELFHAVAKKANLQSFAVDVRSSEVQKALQNNGIRLERAIGVIYRPQTERLSHYYFCDMTRQFDVLVFWESTSAVVPLDKQAPPTRAEPETFPSGL